VEFRRLFNALRHFGNLFAHLLLFEQYNVFFFQFICRWQRFAAGLLMGLPIKLLNRCKIILIKIGLVVDQDYVFRLYRCH
jgi:hypothetical protein